MNKRVKQKPLGYGVLKYTYTHSLKYVASVNDVYLSYIADKNNFFYKRFEKKLSIYAIKFNDNHPPLSYVVNNLRLSLVNDRYFSDLQRMYDYIFKNCNNRPAVSLKFLSNRPIFDALSDYA